MSDRYEVELPTRAHLNGNLSALGDLRPTLPQVITDSDQVRRPVAAGPPATAAAASPALNPLRLYGEQLQRHGSQESAGVQTWLQYADGRRLLLDLPRWTAAADSADDRLLARCVGPVLDIGCGPGRLIRALVQRGVDCLGVDVAPTAVALARSGGMPILHASVFDPILTGTRWATVLLADGNIGIGGDPQALLHRVGELCTGKVLVELDPPSIATCRVQVRLETSCGEVSDWFEWAHVNNDDIDDLAARAGLTVTDLWSDQGRVFAELTGKS